MRPIWLPIHRAAAHAVAAPLECVAQLIFSEVTSHCVARHLGDAAALGGDRITARGQFARAHELRLEALALAQRHADPEALFHAAHHLIGYGAPQRWDERVRLADECVGWPRRGVSSQTLGTALWNCGIVQLSRGERARAEELWRQLRELADRTRVASLGLHVRHSEVNLAIADGRFEEALLLIRRFVELADEAGAALRGRRQALLMSVAPALHLGRPTIGLDALDEYARQTSQSGDGRAVADFMYVTATRAFFWSNSGGRRKPWRHGTPAGRRRHH
jgi:tetratricopeptide (TPR) repeat protein